MRADRLLKLADFLETVPRKAFDLDHWQSAKPTKPEGPRPGDCGFAGCAVGWAAHANLFPEFSFSRPYGGGPVPTFDEMEGWLAVADLFEISTNDGLSEGRGEAEHQFLGACYPKGNATPKQVAKRIRAFVKSGGKSPTPSVSGE